MEEFYLEAVNKRVDCCFPEHLEQICERKGRMKEERNGRIEESGKGVRKVGMMESRKAGWEQLRKVGKEGGRNWKN